MTRTARSSSTRSIGVGVRAQWRAWDDATAPWSSTPAVLRATWDYTLRRDEFLAWARSVPTAVQSVRRRAVELRQDLPARSRSCRRPGHADGGRSSRAIRTRRTRRGARSSSSRPSAPGRAGPDGSTPRPAAADARPDAARAKDAPRWCSRTCAGVDTAGETALVYLDGRFSHAVRKGPMLPVGTAHGVDVVRALRAGEHRRACAEPGGGRGRRRGGAPPRRAIRPAAVRPDRPAARRRRPGRRGGRDHRAVPVPVLRADAAPRRPVRRCDRRSADELRRAEPGAAARPAADEGDRRRTARPRGGRLHRLPHGRRRARRVGLRAGDGRGVDGRRARRLVRGHRAVPAPAAGSRSRTRRSSRARRTASAKVSPGSSRSTSSPPRSSGSASHRRTSRSASVPGSPIRTTPAGSPRSSATRSARWPTSCTTTNCATRSRPSPTSGCASSTRRPCSPACWTRCATPASTRRSSPRRSRD